MSRYKTSLIGIVVAGVLFSGAAHAGTVSPSLSGSVVISDGLTNNTWTFSDTASDNGDGTFTYVGTNSPASTLWNFSWDITVNPDPFISSTLTIINKTLSTKHFDILFMLPVGSPFAPGLKSGSMSADFWDFNGNGSPADGAASLTNVDWSGRIDGVDAMFLSAFDINCGGVNCSGSLGTVSDGPLLHTAGVSSSIGIHLAFDLSAGDKVSFVNFFEVVPVPVPAAVWLFGTGLGLLSIFSRKKK